jgi:hypothetical protein
MDSTPKSSDLMRLESAAASASPAMIRLYRSVIQMAYLWRTQLANYQKVRLPEGSSKD